MINFDATATYGAEVVSITINADYSGTIRVRNRSGEDEVSIVEIAIPAGHAFETVHQRTGPTGILVSLDTGDAINAILNGARSHLQAVIDAGKHAL